MHTEFAQARSMMAECEIKQEEMAASQRSLEYDVQQLSSRSSPVKVETQVSETQIVARTASQFERLRRTDRPHENCVLELVIPRRIL